MSTADGVLQQAATLTADSFNLHLALGGVNYASARAFICWHFHSAPMKVCTHAEPVPKFFLPIALVLFNYVSLHSFWAFQEKVLMHLLSRYILHREPEGHASRLFETATIYDMKTSIDHPNWGFKRCQSLLKLDTLVLLFATKDLPGLLISRQYRTINFYGPKFATPGPLPMPTPAL